MSENKKIVIPLPLMTLNKYTNEQRRHYQKGAKAKKAATYICHFYVDEAKRNGLKISGPIKLNFTWFCKNRREDPDNIAFQKKFILDGMVTSELLQNDGWSQIKGFTDKFVVDKNERVEIEIMEVGE